MNIIQKQPNPSGAYPPIQSWQGEAPPEGYYEITADTTEFYNGFITPTIENGVVTSLACDTDAWNVWKDAQPQPLSPLEQARADALEHISGKCSAAIYSGVDVNGKHYSFTQTAQGNIKGMLIEIQNGKTVFLYCADNEPLTTYTADEIKAIAQVMGEWINVNTVYYEQLKTWINRETDEVVLSTIHYGSQLPNDLMQELVAKLASACVDITKYASMLGVDK